MPGRAAVFVLGSLIVIDLVVTVVLAQALLRPLPVSASADGAAAGERGSFEARARARYHAPVYAPTFSAYMSSVTFEAEQRPPNAAVKVGHAVWVITVHAPNGACDSCRMERPPRLHRVYSVVYDASTGREVDACGGCEWIKESRPETAADHLVARTPSWLQNGLVRFLYRS
ncbi:MAG: hypothetical protein DLM67_08285 [Candidatus Nephthysia bennettiae]|uniref:Uncharacterized protein n=1 Tax=Candidatus Nephthysia bennettiae TaxID=3127016 RepID=A0A934N6P8_9BACT|nr:hypothetical protein [Candidatus Dormibacteraeota bacterium]MBJ7612848.1 hypothetical protein [Candidatus Dormibacteraeota bacterium]PZR97282.1 MAG: hypothetical protein DLM67_08285 [Candidatus Dormibacteraeota bacterium]